jgi:hypothetical protein
MVELNLKHVEYAIEKVTPDMLAHIEDEVMKREQEHLALADNDSDEEGYEHESDGESSSEDL